MGVQLQLFGPFQAQIGAQKLASPARRATEHLLALLALHPLLSRERLASLLWPDSTDERGRYYLRRALMDLRGMLGADADCVVSPEQPLHHLQLVLPPDACDLWRFDRALVAGDTATAVALYAGPLLEGWDFDWVLTARYQRQHQFLTALEQRAECAPTAALALPPLRRLVALDPTRESAWRALMRALAETGDPAGVVQAFRDLRLALQNHLRVAPSPETLDCYAHLRGSGRLPAPRKPSSPALPPRLPRPTSAFFGRAEVLQQCVEQLRTTRLLSLVGIGGIGKTRLAIATAEAVAESGQFADGIAWVDLAALTDPDLVPVRVAAALGATEPESLPPLLWDRELLLVLDNCEHVLDAVASLADTLLSECPHVHLLTTSREPLGIAGETVWRVLPLAEEAAIQLFENRAQQVQRNWKRTDANHALVARICHRLDDLALAIELAAARTATLSLEELLQRLDDRFALLTGGSRTALRRHQTLRAAIDWSWDLLTEDERSALRQLAIFANPFTLAAAEATCDQGIDTVSALVNKSLVVFDPHVGRYHLLETVREYVLERGLGIEGLQARQRHLRYTLSLAQRWQEAQHGPEGPAWTAHLLAVHDNIRVALTFALESDPARALELTGILWQFWSAQGFRTEGLQQVRLALDTAAAAGLPPPVRTVLGAAALAYETGDIALARAELDRVFLLARPADDSWAEGEAERIRGLTCWSQGHADESRACYTRSLAHFQAANSRAGQAATLACLGHLAWNQGEQEEALRHTLASQSLYRTLADDAGIAETSAQLGLIERSRGHYDRALPYLVEALTIRRRLGLRAGVASLIHHLGVLAYLQRDLTMACERLTESTALWRELGDAGGTALSLYYLGLTLQQRRASEEAVSALLRARAIRRTQSADRPLAAIQFALGTIWLDQGKFLLAEEALRESALLQHAQRLPALCSESLHALAALEVRRVNPVQAARLLGCAEALRQGLEELEDDHPFRDEADRAVHAQLTAERVRSAWEEGRRQSPTALLPY